MNLTYIHILAYPHLSKIKKWGPKRGCDLSKVAQWVRGWLWPSFVHTNNPKIHKAVSPSPPAVWHHLLSLQALLSLQWNIPAQRGLKEQGWNVRFPCPLAVACLLNWAQQAFAQGRPPAHVQHWTVRTNFSLYARGYPHTALCQAKPPKHVLSDGALLRLGVVLEPFWANSINVPCQAQWSHWRPWAKFCMKPDQVSECPVPRLNVWLSVEIRSPDACLQSTS